MRYCVGLILVWSSLAIVSGTVLAETTSAQKLLTVVPDDTFAFVATSGGDALQEDFGQSIVGKLWHDPRVQMFCKSCKDAIANAMKENNNDQAFFGQFKQVANFVKTMLRCPIVAGVAKTQGEQGSMYGYVVIDGGGLRQEIDQAVSAILKIISEKTTVKFEEIKVGPYTMKGDISGEMPLCFGWAEKYFVISIKDPTGQALGNLKNPKDTRERFSSLKLLEGHGDALIYYNDVGFRDNPFLLFDFNDEDTGEIEREHFKKYQTILDDHGFSSLGTYTMRYGFDRGMLVSNSLTKITNREAPMFSCMRPVDLSQLSLVHKDVLAVGILDTDIKQIVNMISQMIKVTISEEDYEKMTLSIAAFEQENEIKLKENLLDGIEGQFVYYIHQPAGVSQLIGSALVLVAKTKESDQLEGTLSTLADMLKGVNNQWLQVTTQQHAGSGKNINIIMIPPLAMLQISPCWSVVDDQLIISTNISSCYAAIDQITTDEAKSSSFLINEHFVKARNGFPPELLVLNYVDSKRLASSVMNTLQQFWPMAVMFINEKSTVKIPAVLPYLDPIFEQMGPSWQYSWFDRHGWRSHDEGPAGSATLVAGVGVAAAGVAILMPALGREREMAKRVQCATQLRGIGQAIMLYQNDFRGKNPTQLEDLIKTEDLVPKMFLCPSTEDKEGQYSYVYRSSDLDEKASSQMVLMYDNHTNHQGETRNVLFADGHVMKMTEQAFQAAIEKDNELRRGMGLAEKPAE